MAVATGHPALVHLPNGWMEHGEQMLALLEQHRPAVVVELGTCHGRSAVAMARVLRAWGGLLYCVDTWAGRPHRIGRQGWPIRMGIAARNLQVAKVAASVRLIVGTTHEVAQAWTGPTIDCLYVDADHSYESCLRDLELWTPHVRQGGLIMGDDYGNPKCPGVQPAWDAFEQSAGMPLSRVPTPGTSSLEMRLVYGVKP
jgi:predicted O-methyltransferase YrrM